MKTRVFGIALAFGLLVGVAAAQDDKKAGKSAVEVGKPAPKWRVSDARGVKQTTKLADYKGRWVVVEFWGFW